MKQQLSSIVAKRLDPDCPRCGGFNVAEVEPFGGWESGRAEARVWCSYCRFTVEGPTVERAIKRWNRNHIIYGHRPWLAIFAIAVFVMFWASVAAYVGEILPK